MAPPKDSRFTDTEARQRFEAALRGAREVGHKTFKESKVGKPKRNLGKVETKPTKAKKGKPGP